MIDEKTWKTNFQSLIADFTCKTLIRDPSIREERRKVQSPDWSSWQGGEYSKQTFLGCLCFSWLAVVSEPTRVFWVGPLTGLHMIAGKSDHWSQSACSRVNGQPIPDRMYSRPRQGYRRSRIKLHLFLFFDLVSRPHRVNVGIHLISQIYISFVRVSVEWINCSLESYLQLNSKEVSRSSGSGSVQFLHLGFSFYQSHFLEIPAYATNALVKLCCSFKWKFLLR